MENEILIQPIIINHRGTPVPRIGDWTCRILPRIGEIVENSRRVLTVGLKYSCCVSKIDANRDRSGIKGDRGKTDHFRFYLLLTESSGTEDVRLAPRFHFDPVSLIPCKYACCISGASCREVQKSLLRTFRVCRDIILHYGNV